MPARICKNRYLSELMAWSKDQDVLTFVFEAFDENWKGSDDPLEPEKHWGLYGVESQNERQPQVLNPS